MNVEDYEKPIGRAPRIDIKTGFKKGVVLLQVGEQAITLEPDNARALGRGIIKASKKAKK